MAPIVGTNPTRPVSVLRRERHAEILFGLLEGVGTGGNLTTDAHLAALAIEHQAELHSTDVDFHRFSGLRWKNPVAPKTGDTIPIPRG